MKTPERIGIKFGTVDYVLEICPQNKFDDDRSICEIYDVCDFLYFSPTDLEATPPNQFLRKMA